MERLIRDDPDWSPINPHHVAPFLMGCNTNDGSRFVMLIERHDPERRSVMGTITESPMETGDLRKGITRTFEPYGDFFVKLG